MQAGECVQRYDIWLMSMFLFWRLFDGLRMKGHLPLRHIVANSASGC